MCIVHKHYRVSIYKSIANNVLCFYRSSFPIVLLYSALYRLRSITTDYWLIVDIKYKDRNHLLNTIGFAQGMLVLFGLVVFFGPTHVNSKQYCSPIPAI